MLSRTRRLTVLLCAALPALPAVPYCAAADRDPPPAVIDGERRLEQPAKPREKGREADRSKAQRFEGEVAAVDATKLTLVRRGDGGEQRVDVPFSATTKVEVETDQMEKVAGERGARDQPKRVAGKVEELKVGQRVIVTESDGVATAVVVARPRQAREGGERPRAEGAVRGDGEARRAGARDGEAPKVGPRDGEAPRRGPRDGEAPKVGPRDGDAPKAGPRDGEQPRVGPRDGEAPKAGPRDGEAPRKGPRDGEQPRIGPRDGEAPKNGPRDGEAPKAGPRDGEGGKAGPGDGAAEDGVRVDAAGRRWEKLAGDVAGVDGSTLTVRLGRPRADGSKEASADVVRGADIRIEGRPGTLADLKPGMPVTVNLRNGKAIAIEVPVDLSKPGK